LVSWWPGDKNENDIVGSNNPTVVNAVTLVPGEVLDGFTFGDIGGTGCYASGTCAGIQIPPASNLANQQFTWAAWVEPGGPGPNNDQYGSNIVVQDTDDYDDVVALGWTATDNRFVFTVGNIGSEVLFSTDVFPAGTFYFVAGTYDGSTFQLFVNGVLEASLAEVKTIPYSSQPWMIGSADPYIAEQGYPRTWNGVIDEVQAYNVALSTSQIQAIYNAGSGGVCKGLTFSPSSLKFPRRQVGAAGPPEAVTVSNVFPLAVKVEKVATSGDFAQTNTCPVPPSTLASGANCSVNVTFTPTQSGTRTGRLTIVDSAPASPQTVGLAGVATDVSLSTAALRFSRQAVGTTSAAQTVTVTNVGSVTVNFTGSGIAIAGTGQSDFIVSANTCGTSLTSGAECTVSVEFKPTVTGVRSATLEFNDDGGASPQTVALTGAATDVSLSPIRLNFGSHTVGTTSRAKTVTVTNVGAVAVNFTGSGIALAGADLGDFLISANTCGPSLAGGANCTVSIEFKPMAQGTRTATLDFNDDGGASPQTVALTGSGT